MMIDIVRRVDAKFKKNGRLSNNLNAIATGMIFTSSIGLARLPHPSGELTVPEVLAAGIFLSGLLVFYSSIVTVNH